MSNQNQTLKNKSNLNLNFNITLIFIFWYFKLINTIFEKVAIIKFLACNCQVSSTDYFKSLS